MKLFPIVFFFLLAVVCLAVAAAQEARDGICHSQQTTTKLIARRIWPSQTATTTTTTAQPTTVTTTSSSTTTTAQPSTISKTRPTTTTTKATTTTPLPILFNCSVNDPAFGNMCTNLTSSGGVVQSPNFPGDYGNTDRLLKVNITAPEGWKIQLQFTTFILNLGITDYVYINDGQSNLFPSSITDFTISTESNKIVIFFKTNESGKSIDDIFKWQATFSVTKV